MFLLCVGTRAAEADDGGGRTVPARAYCLELRSADGELVFSDNIAPGGTFVLRHIHSVHKTPVEETLGLGPGNSVAILEGRYSDFGAGLSEHAEKDQAFSFAGGEARLIFSQRSVPNIEIRVGRFAKHTLIVKGKPHRLALWVRPGEYVVLQTLEGACTPRAP
ncbi:MAG: DUF1850 domain-containing protein [Desulfovibrio sp.]|nr:DUF1850 domain-containing protein [Desulfovibrio sp.]